MGQPFEFQEGEEEGGIGGDRGHHGGELYPRGETISSNIQLQEGRVGLQHLGQVLCPGIGELVVGQIKGLQNIVRAQRLGDGCGTVVSNPNYARRGLDQD